MTPLESRQELKKMRQRYMWIVVLFFSVMFIGIVVSVMHIQFRERDRWMYWKNLQVKDSVLVQPTRGNIFSDDGALMAATVPTYALYMDMKAYQTAENVRTEQKLAKARQEYKDSLEKYIAPLSAALSAKLGDRTPAEYEAHLRRGFERGSREYLLSRRRVSYFDLKEIRRYPFFVKGRNRSGFYEKKYMERQKVFGSLASRTIGDIYADLDKGGKSGLELRYDSLLRGKPGLSSRQKVAGRYMDVITLEPENGYDLHTTLNLTMQDIVETALRRKLVETEATSGTAVLMEVKTGKIKAISNLGEVGPGQYAEIQNYAVNDLSEPGSTFKTIAMMAMLEDSKLDPNETVNTGNGRKTYYGHTITDHNANHGGYGEITAAQAIWYSSNIGMAELAERYFSKDPKKFVDRLYKMGMADSLYLDIPGSATPAIPRPDDKKRYWSRTDLVCMAYGYVVRIPPIYTLSYYNAIANDGCYMRPYFVESIEKDGKVKERFQPRVVRRKICSDRTLKEIRLMLDSVVLKGTARGPVRSDIVSISGKTGTALLSKGAAGYRAGKTEYQVSFCGYFPSYDARYSCIVVIRAPQRGYPSGGTMSGAVFKEIAEQVYARELQVEVARLPKDTLDIHPQLKATARTDAYRYLSGRLDLSGEELPPLVEQEADRVPRVIGMGLREAVYTLENAGLQVSVSGQGKVFSQVPAAGQRYRQGDRVTIKLK